MLKDDELIPICRSVAARFVADARLLKGPSDPFDELVNVAYASAKELRSLELARSTITWNIIHYISTPESSLRRRGKRARSDLIDRRKGIRRSPERTPLETIEALERSALLVHAVAQLTPLEANVIYFRFRDGKSYREIGPLIGRSYEWVRMELPKILQKLRRLMR